MTLTVPVKAEYHLCKRIYSGAAILDHMRLHDVPNEVAAECLCIHKNTENII